MCKVVLIVLRIVLGIQLYLLAVRDYREKQVSVIALLGMNSISALTGIFRMIDTGWNPGDLWWMAADIGGGCLIGFLFLSISYLSEEQIGYGDSILMLILGIGIGGWNLICLLEICSLLLLVSLLWMKKKTGISRKTRIPFYPYVFVGYCIWMLYSLFGG